MKLIEHVKFYFEKDRGIIRCKQYTRKIHTWRLDEELEATRNMIKGTILFRLYNGSYKTANKVLVSAFVERWHAETTSFHMPFGEATITLDDVEQLLEIPIVGKPMVEVKWKEIGSLDSWVSKLLGIPVKNVKAELDRCSKFSVRTSWIIKNLSRSENRICNASPEQITRGFLLVLLGCTLFQDMSGDKVKVKYLYYLQDLKNLDKWAWGAGTLAYLYRMLSKASIMKTKGVCGYLTLMEVNPNFYPLFGLNTLFSQNLLINLVFSCLRHGYTNIVPNTGLRKINRSTAKISEHVNGIRHSTWRMQLRRSI